ncbi:MAG TPA: exosortase K [Blastocatellia bacterium]|nr:exosortase K [Blastocatellia bacterium]
MRKRFAWNRLAKWAVVLLCALALKLYYSSASADELRWILAPTTALVEVVSGSAFEFESHAGYINRDRSFLIAPSCAGANFLIAAFLMLSVGKLLQDRSRNVAWRFIPVAAVTAYLATIAANAIRIALALWLERQPENNLLNPSQLHRVEGIVVYFGSLLLLFMASERMSLKNPSNLLRRSFVPLLVYYAIVLAIPLANGGYRQGFKFWEHSAAVLVIPLLLVLLLAALGHRGDAELRREPRLLGDSQATPPQS